MESITKVFSDIVKPYIDKTASTSGDPKTVSYADIVSIKDAIAVNAKDVSIKIEPVQAGSGTPSPDNIRAISGWSSAKVTRAGKNILPFDLATIKALNTSGTWNGNTYSRYGVSVTVNLDGTYHVVTSSSPSDTLILVLGDYKRNGCILSGCPSGGSDSKYKVQAFYSGAQLNDYGEGVAITDDNIRSYRIVVYAGAGIIDETFEPMIRLASDTDDTYEPYIGNEYTIDLGGTIYGGTLDVTSGVLTVDKAYIEFDGSVDENWWTNNHRFATSFSPTSVDIPSAITCLCNLYEARTVSELWTNRETTGYLGITAQSGNCFIVDNAHYSNYDSEDLSAFKTFLASNPLQLVYELATPQTIQLTPTQIRMLAGVNTVYANTGDTQVEYFNASVGNLGEVLGELENDVTTQGPQLQALTNEVRGNWATGGVNLFNPSKAIKGIYISDYDGSEKIADENGIATDFIPVIGGQPLTITSQQSGSKWGAWYNSSKQFISGINGYDNLVAPSNAAYGRFTLQNNNNNPNWATTTQIELGDTATPYQPYAKTNVELTQKLSDKILASGNYLTSAANTWEYSGISFTLDKPALVGAFYNYNNSATAGIAIGTSSTNSGSTKMSNEDSLGSAHQTIGVLPAGTYYVWVKALGTSSNQIKVYNLMNLDFVPF